MKLKPGTRVWFAKQGVRHEGTVLDCEIQRKNAIASERTCVDSDRNPSPHCGYHVPDVDVYELQTAPSEAIVQEREAIHGAIEAARK